MNINNISSLLEKFRKLKPSDLFIKESFIESMKEIMNVEVTKAEIRVNGSNIFLTVHPALKTEIYLRKKEILKSLELKLKKNTIKNII